MAYWDSSNTNLTYWTLSGGDTELATKKGGSSISHSARGVDSHDSGKKFFEVDFGIPTGNNTYTDIGFCLSTFATNKYVGNTAGSWGFLNNRFYNEGSLVAAGATLPTGDTTYGVLIDLDNGKAWLVIDGTIRGHNGSSGVTCTASDVENGTNPAWTDTNFVGVDVFPAVTMYTDTQTATLLLTEDEQSSFTLPSGYSAWAGSSPATTLTSFINESYGLLGDALTNFINENYYILTPQSNFLNEIYGLKMSSQLVEYYGDSTVLTKVINEYYGDSPALKKFVNMLYGDSKVLVNAFIETYNITIDLNSYLEEVYTIAEKNVTKGLDEVYGLNLYDPVLKWLDEIYAVNADTVIEESSLIVTIDGVRVYPFHVNFEFNRNSYKAFGEIHLADQESYLLAIENQSVLRIQDGVDDLSFEVEVPRELDTIGETTFMIPAESKSRVLERAPAITREFSASMASELVTSLAAEYGISVSWEVPDWLLPTGTIFANGEIPLDVIRKVTTAIRARLQPTADGDLRVVRNVDTDTTRWSTAAPTYYLTDQRNFFRTSEDVSTRPGFNKYYISDHGSSSFNTFLETQDVSSTEKLIKGYRVPYTGKNLILSHSGGDWVTIESFGWSTENLTETIEIIQGVGKTTHPIYDQISVDYKETNLGGITFREDGTITTETTGQSLIEYTYQTKFWLWLGTDAKIEEVQFWFEEEE